MDMFDNVWGDKSEVVVDHCVDTITFPVRFSPLRLNPCPNISTRLPFSSSVPQVVTHRSSRGRLIQTLLGFGHRATWTTDLVVPPGHQMTLKDTLHTLSTSLVLELAVPNWAKNLTKRTREVHLAFMELKVCYSKSSQTCMPHLCIILRAAIHAGNGGSSQKCRESRTMP